MMHERQEIIEFRLNRKHKFAKYVRFQSHHNMCAANILEKKIYIIQLVSLFNPHQTDFQASKHICAKYK